MTTTRATATQNGGKTVSDEFATYDDVYREFGMADDRDDSNDPEFNNPDGYCEHGEYVGGCGVDWMCGLCEDGISAAEATRIQTEQRTRLVRDRAQSAERLLTKLLQTGQVGGIDAAYFAQEASKVFNPRARYGRH